MFFVNLRCSERLNYVPLNPLCRTTNHGLVHPLCSGQFLFHAAFPSGQLVLFVSHDVILNLKCN